MSVHEKAAAAVTKTAADNGKLIEAGFNALRELAIAPDAPQVQVDEMRLAYMAGAQHLWASIMSVLDPGPDETPGDMMRMEKIQAELDAWQQTLELRLGKTGGVG
ncbi:MAG: hypothetical protein N0C84_05665 [Candidatus Thiodiazotropha taylori]|uniref:Uncharacterized protein n=1 Tax=Candidatus Thiodiazotropha taylori TaxID=2792791 RepID=A0A9E4N3J8_9GAMM|nr:hypothetical protein [Candidatus Thiodiazotropha taylori]MCW4255940.1 hypothetical protein [Candidatus Thiodiazotropha taylori]